MRQLALAFLGLLCALLLLLLVLLGCLLLLVLAPLLVPRSLAPGDGLDEFFVVFWLALLAVICDILQVLSEYAHAHADIVLPDAAALAPNPWLVLGVAILAGGSADAADELVLLGLGLWLRLLLL